MPAATELNPATYAKLSEAFLTLGPRYSAAARLAGVSVATARAAWMHGFPGQGFGPICDKFAEKAGLTKAQPVQTQRVVESAPGARPDLRDALSNGAVDAAHDEIALLAAFRRNVGCALGISHVLLRNLEGVAAIVTERLNLQVCNADYVSIDSILNPLEKASKAIGVLAQTTRHVFEMQRLLVGAPSNITEHRGTGAPGESQEKIQVLGKMLEMMQRNRILAPNTPPPVDTQRYEGEEEDVRLLDAVEERKTA